MDLSSSADKEATFIEGVNKTLVKCVETWGLLVTILELSMSQLIQYLSGQIV